MPLGKEKKKSLKTQKAIYLLPSVNDIFCQCQSIYTGPPSNWVMSWGRMSHLHSTELQKRLAQCYTTKQQLPVLKGKKDHKYKHACEAPESLSCGTVNFKATLVTLCSSQSSEVLFWRTKVMLLLEKHFTLSKGLVITLKKISS